ncbi:hypothetical protein [Rubinisphaera margarita]|uniref:hypothetical protein n=1 Tax=Rubinisphaera margarita TaxID=2909586 RepID=UPI001EE94878|nr:hypothetical protein [Rubinisphaera margarita]MCG6156341.1 hypothetical protein [Rubinisphaera margarita]
MPQKINLPGPLVRRTRHDLQLTMCQFFDARTQGIDALPQKRGLDKLSQSTVVRFILRQHRVGQASE